MTCFPFLATLRRRTPAPNPATTRAATPSAISTPPRPVAVDATSHDRTRREVEADALLLYTVAEATRRRALAALDQELAS